LDLLYSQEVGRLSRSLDLISPNEEVDDIATGALKFVLVDHYLAQMLQKGEHARWAFCLRGCGAVWCMPGVGAFRHALFLEAPGWRLKRPGYKPP
jgi:hypothetical protein